MCVIKSQILCRLGGGECCLYNGRRYIWFVVCLDYSWNSVGELDCVNIHNSRAESSHEGTSCKEVYCQVSPWRPPPKLATLFPKALALYKVVLHRLTTSNIMSSHKVPCCE